MNTTPRKHTVTPWKIEKDTQGGWWFENKDGGFTGKIDEAISEPDAAFIVLAVNSHEGLVRVIKAIRYALIMTPGINVPDIIETMDKIIAQTEGK